MRLYTDIDYFYRAPSFPLVEAVNGLVRDLVRKKLEESGGDWSSFALGTSETLVTKADIDALEGKILATGYRFSFSSNASARDRPEIYKSTDDADNYRGAAFAHPDAPTGPPDEAGRELRGCGDNVVRRNANIVGVARYVRTSEQVIDYMRNGVPAGTIAVIDDSGGTLTAPIIEQFTAVICAGGTVRSHLGILTREFGIPCLMNARLSGVQDGDRVEVEVSAPAKTAEAYQTGQEMKANIWRLPQ